MKMFLACWTMSLLGLILPFFNISELLYEIKSVELSTLHNMQNRASRKLLVFVTILLDTVIIDTILSLMLAFIIDARLQMNIKWNLVLLVYTTAVNSGDISINMYEL